MNQAPASTIRLDDDTVADLLDEISAMAAANRSFVSGLVDLEDAALGKIAKAARAVRYQIENGEPASEAIASLSPKYQLPIRAAIEVMATTGSTEPIDETIRLIRDANEHRQQIILNSINPLLSVTVAATVVFFVLPWILVSISKAELIKTPFSTTVTQISETLVENFMLAAAATITVIGVFAAGLVWSMKRSISGADFLRDHSTFCRWLAMQIGTTGHRRPVAAAPGRIIAMAAEVVGPRFAVSWSETIKRLQGGTQTPASMAVPPATPEPLTQCLGDWISGGRDPDSIATDMRQLSDQYRHAISHQRTFWVHVIPRCVTWFVMIMIIGLLIRAILIPMFRTVIEAAG